MCGLCCVFKDTVVALSFIVRPLFRQAKTKRTQDEVDARFMRRGLWRSTVPKADAAVDLFAGAVLLPGIARALHVARAGAAVVLINIK